MLVDPSIISKQQHKIDFPLTCKLIQGHTIASDHNLLLLINVFGDKS